MAVSQFEETFGVPPSCGSPNTQLQAKANHYQAFQGHDRREIPAAQVWCRLNIFRLPQAGAAHGAVELVPALFVFILTSSLLASPSAMS
jgi:hypothetical protein